MNYSEEKLVQLIHRTIKKDSNFIALHHEVQDLRRDLNEKVSELDKKVSELDKKVGDLSQKFNAMSQRIDRIEAELHKHGLLFEDLEKKFATILEVLDHICKKLDRLDDIGAKTESHETRHEIVECALKNHIADQTMHPKRKKRKT